MANNRKNVDSYLTLVNLRRLVEINGIKRYRDNAESRHRMVMSLFPHVEDDEARRAMGVLFRGERNRNESLVLIRSTTPPAQLPGIKSLKENLARYNDESYVKFRVTVSPIVRYGNKERALFEFNDLEDWLQKRLSKALEEVELIQIKDEKVKRAKSNNFVKLVQTDGIAKIKDVDALIDLLQNGVGRNKSYGAGLLTLVEV